MDQDHQPIGGFGKSPGEGIGTGAYRPTGTVPQAQFDS
jgi:hypothetical protein